MFQADWFWTVISVLWPVICHYLLFCVSKKKKKKETLNHELGHVRFDVLKWQGQAELNSNPNNNVNHKVWECVFLMYLRFSELNSDSRNLRNCSLPTGSFKTSSMPNAHLFTLCWPGSLLQDKSCALKAWNGSSHKIHKPTNVYILCFLCANLASSSQSVVSSVIQGLEGSGGVRKGSYSTYCSV